MTTAVTIKASEARVLAAARVTAPKINFSEAVTLSVINIPAVSVKSSEARTLAVAHQPSQNIRLEQARVLAVVRGHIADPAVRAWTFTLDGHDFYVLELGETETLVYDTHSDMWYTWGSDNFNFWRVVTGTNWIDGAKVTSPYGSSIVVGDYIQGVLYILDPDSDTDDDSLQGAVVPHTFQRIVQGQVTQKGYNASPCYAVELLGSIGQLTDSSTTIQLEYSDDRGDSYQDAGTVNVSADDVNARVTWRSLGSIYGPGRLFRITDYGALRRIDSLDMEGGE